MQSPPLSDTRPVSNVSEQALEAAVSKKVLRRIVPFIFFFAMVGYLDRSNVSFAALTMNESLKFDATAFGIGAGIFSIGYCIFGIPANFALRRFGARFWFSVILLVWGVVSASTAFIHTKEQFYIARFLLGVAESGQGVGTLFFVTLWAPAKLRGRMMSVGGISSLVSAMIGAPLSAWILVHFAGASRFQSWQWLFLLEALPSLLMALITVLFISSRPAEARWLNPQERAWLVGTLETEYAARRLSSHHSFKAALLDYRISLLAITQFFQILGFYGLLLWIPLIVKSHGLSTSQIGWSLGVVNAIAAVGVWLWGKHSDHTKERKYHIVLPLLVTIVGAVLAAYAPTPLLVLVGLCLATWGAWASITTFWTIPPLLLSGAAAAGGIAFINSVATLGGFFGPLIIGWIKTATGSFAGGLVSVAIAMVIAAILLMVVFRRPAEFGPRSGQ
ncbi:MAG: MFS transporter [Janthinobacterium lividum]